MSTKVQRQKSLFFVHDVDKMELVLQMMEYEKAESKRSWILASSSESSRRFNSRKLKCGVPRSLMSGMSIGVVRGLGLADQR